jgi:YggT family protein
MGIVRLLLYVYMIILLVRIFSSWFPTPTSGAMRSIMDIVYAVTEPVLRPLRRILPPVRLGAMALDLSPIIVFVVIQILLASIH